MPVEQNKNNNPGKKPEGQKPKNIWTPLLISLVLVLIFSWVFNAVSKSQYKETRWDEFVEVKNAGQLEEVDDCLDGGVVDLVVSSKGSDHYGPYTIFDLFHVHQFLYH